MNVCVIKLIIKNHEIKSEHEQFNFQIKDHMSESSVTSRTSEKEDIQDKMTPQVRNVTFNETEFVFNYSTYEEETLIFENESKNPTKPAIKKPYFVKRDLELESRLDNILAQERDYVPVSKIGNILILFKIKEKLMRKIVSKRKSKEILEP